MELLESVKVALEGLWTNKLRAFLTMLGIVIGIAAVIAVVAIGQGGRALLTAEFEKFGSNLFFVYVDRVKEGKTNPNDFSANDMETIKELVSEVTGISPSMSMQYPIKTTKKNVSARVQGCTPDYMEMHNVELNNGRFFTDIDTKTRRKVIVIEEKLAKDLFSRENAIGETVKIDNFSFVIIGIAKDKNSMLDGGGVNSAYIPYTILQQLVNSDMIYNFELQVKDVTALDAATSKTVTILERKHNIKDRYSVRTLDQELETVNKVTGIMTLIIGAIAGISLFVGGIGVMNIMLVSVTERTREIGIRKALGAKRRDIMLQFIIESLVICTFGGIIGMLIGIGGAFAIAKFAKWPPLVSWTTVIIAFMFSSAVGLFFGIYPANKAAKLDPIEALRYE